MKKEVIYCSLLYIFHADFKSRSEHCQHFFYWLKHIQCIADTYCPIPPAVDNGYIFVSTGVKVGNTLTYQCNDGFTINGQQVIRCLPDGSWEEAPRCTGKYILSIYR